MQLTLLTRLGERVVMRRAEPPSTLPGAWRDSAISQLDALAAAHEPLVSEARRRRVAWGAAIAGVLLLWSASAWRQAIEPPRRPEALAAAIPAPLEAAAPVVTDAAPAAASVAALQPVNGTAAPPAAADAAVDSAAEDAARRARARQLARALQRKAALLRADAEAQRQRELALQAQQAEQAARQQALAEAARQREAAAAEQARLLALQREQAARRGVRESCAAAGGFFAEQLCHARECRRPEQQADAVCVRLREFELARLRDGADH